MRTAFKVTSACLAIMLTVLGCARRPGLDKDTQYRQRLALERKQAIDGMLGELKDAFEIVWDNVEVQDDRSTRGMLSVEVDEKMLYVTTDDGLLFILDAALGRRRAAYMPGSSHPITPPIVRGSFLKTDFIYLVHDNSIHAIDEPEREGMLTPAWVVRHNGIISTPLCETENFLFFGARDQRVFAVFKSAAEGRHDTWLIDRLDDRMKTAPVALNRVDRPFFVDASGKLYRFGGQVATMLKPLQEGLGPVDVPLLVDGPSATLLVASDNYKLYAINANNPRTIKWTGELGSKPSESLYIYNRSVYVLNENGELRAFHLDPTEAGMAGKPLWGGRPVTGVRKIVSKGKENALYVLRPGNKIAKLDTASGEILWERELPQVDYAPVNRHDSVIYLGIKEGWLWALKPR